jgi:hypothetical protein
VGTYFSGFFIREEAVHKSPEGFIVGAAHFALFGGTALPVSQRLETEFDGVHIHFYGNLFYKFFLTTSSTLTGRSS